PSARWRAPAALLVRVATSIRPPDPGRGPDRRDSRPSPSCPIRGAALAWAVLRPTGGGRPNVLTRRPRSAAASAMFLCLIVVITRPAIANAKAPGVGIQACWNQAGPLATPPWVVYSTFTDDQGTFDLYLDEYTPRDIGGGKFFPAVVVVHGGSWDGG